MPRNWFVYSEDNVRAILAIIKSAGRKINIGWIAGEAGFDRHEFSRIRNGKSDYSRISERAYLATIKILTEHKGKNFLDDFTDVGSVDLVAIGLNRLFDVTTEETQGAIANFCGVYTAYRYSFRLRDKKMILRGLAEFYKNDDGNAVQMLEIYRIQKAPKISDSEMYFERAGYLIPDGGAKSAKVLCHKTDGSKDFEVIFFSEMLTHGHRPNPAQIVSMKGFLVDWQKNTPYATTIIMRRHEDREISVVENKFDHNFLQAISQNDGEIKDLISNMDRNFIPWTHQMVEL